MNSVSTSSVSTQTEYRAPDEAIPRIIAEFGLRVITPKTDEITAKKVFKAITKTLCDWQKIVIDRFRNLSTDPDPKLSRSKNIQNLVDDKNMVADYETLKSFIESDMEAMQKFCDESRYIMVLTDSNQRIQGLASMIERTDSIFLETLMTAAWNAPMHGKIAPEYRSLIVKGVGTTLMRQIYELAVLKKKSRVQLYSLQLSVPFYERLNMRTSCNDNMFHFPVSQTSVPESLRSVKNLLPKDI